MTLCEIFRTGTHTDSKGNKHTYTISDLDAIISNFEAKNPDVPICCGHPETNSPAYGWVNELKRKGGRLYADFKNVRDEFKEAVKKGLFKTRSVSLTPDMMLRHIAFLGGQAPAIKGLEEFCFNECENEIFIDFSEFSENPKEEIHTAATSSNVAPFEGNGRVEIPFFLTRNKGEKMSEELQQKLDDTEKELEKTKTELNDKNKEIEYLKSQAAAKEKEQQTKEFEEFCDNAIKDGHILPVHKQNVMNILEACASSEPFEFSDSDGNKTTKEAAQNFKEFINSLTSINYEEIANKKKVDKQENIDFEDASAIVEAIFQTQKEYESKGITLSNTEALAKVKGE